MPLHLYGLLGSRHRSKETAWLELRPRLLGNGFRIQTYSWPPHLAGTSAGRPTTHPLSLSPAWLVTPLCQLGSVGAKNTRHGCTLPCGVNATGHLGFCPQAGSTYFLTCAILVLLYRSKNVRYRLVAESTLAGPSRPSYLRLFLLRGQSCVTSFCSTS